MPLRLAFDWTFLHESCRILFRLKFYAERNEEVGQDGIDE